MHQNHRDLIWWLPGESLKWIGKSVIETDVIYVIWLPDESLKWTSKWQRNLIAMPDESLKLDWQRVEKETHDLESLKWIRKNKKFGILKVDWFLVFEQHVRETGFKCVSGHGRGCQTLHQYLITWSDSDHRDQEVKWPKEIAFELYWDIGKYLELTGRGRESNELEKCGLCNQC